MLFYSLNKSTEIEMLLKIYRKLLELNINPSSFIYKRMIPKNKQEIIDILLVNDILIKIKKKNRLFGKIKQNFPVVINIKEIIDILSQSQEN